MGIKEKLGKTLLFFDGAMGTVLQEQGLGLGELPETWNFAKEETVFRIHKEYLDSGCHIIKTNTFGANRLKLRDTGYTVRQTILKGVALAKKAARQHAGEAYVALDIGPTGKLLKPFGDLDFEEAYDIFSEMVRAATSS